MNLGGYNACREGKSDPGGGLGVWSELSVVDGASVETFFRSVPPIGIGKFPEMVSMREHDRRFGLSVDGNAPNTHLAHRFRALAQTGFERDDSVIDKCSISRTAFLPAT